MRFILEMALYLADLLQRKLIVPPYLRMRKCDNPQICAKTSCVVRKDDYWCPTELFLDKESLAEAGGEIVADEVEFLKDKTTEHLKDAFAGIYSKDSLWFERLPESVAPRLNADHSVIPEAQGEQLFTLPYYRFHLGCELSYFNVQPFKWTTSSKEKKVFGFYNEFANISADVLYLDGTPHSIGLTPTAWSTEDALKASQEVWELGVVYHKSIAAFAAKIRDSLRKASPSQTYVCVHLRRGDFVTAGWLGKASDLKLVEDNIASYLETGEGLYLATDEENEETLQGLRRLGALKWSDFGASLSKSASDTVAAQMLAFQDYVGLVEQMVCAEARVFVGSKCSSFTGGILNLRRTMVQDFDYYSVVNKHSDN